MKLLPWGINMKRINMKKDTLPLHVCVGGEVQLGLSKKN